VTDAALFVFVLGIAGTAWIVFVIVLMFWLVRYAKKQDREWE
jgi:hypothetical protein